jgi:hypothetical protein
MARYTFVVLANAVEGQDDEFNKWYDDRHLPDVLAVKGFVAAQRFKLANTDPAQEFTHRYLSLYEVETDDLDETNRGLMEATQTGNMPISESLDAAGAIARYFEPITDRVTADSSRGNPT